MSNLWVGITNNDWFDFLRERAHQGLLEEANFWRPSSRNFAALQPGGLFLFKLHAPRNVIAGGGFFLHAQSMPVRLAWETFGYSNGVPSEGELLTRLAELRGTRVAPSDSITCISLAEPFFLEQPIPWGLRPGNQVGKSYELDSEEGRTLLAAVQRHLQQALVPAAGEATAQLRERYGKPGTVLPRLGQGGFSLMVSRAYEHRCAMTGERTRPALEAAHIRPYSTGGEHRLSNGLLLRRDLHSLFDQGYLGVHPERRVIMVSRRIRAEFENGRDYYALDGRKIRVPAQPEWQPDAEALQYHADEVYRP